MTTTDQVWLAGLLISLALVWLTPAIVAIARGVNVGGVLMMTLMAPFSLGVTWFIALAWSLGRKPAPVPPSVNYYYPYPPPPPPALEPVPVGPPPVTYQQMQVWDSLAKLRHTDS